MYFKYLYKKICRIMKLGTGRIREQTNKVRNKDRGRCAGPRKMGYVGGKGSVQGRGSMGGALHPGTHPGGGSMEGHGQFRVTFRCVFEVLG